MGLAVTIKKKGIFLKHTLLRHIVMQGFREQPKDRRGYIFPLTLALVLREGMSGV